MEYWLRRQGQAAAAGAAAGPLGPGGPGLAALREGAGAPADEPLDDGARTLEGRLGETQAQRAGGRKTMEQMF